MLFNSLSFLIFFPVITLLFFLLPHKFRWILLLLASSFFYMFFKPIYILILLSTIIIDYYAGIKIEEGRDKKKKKLFLVISIIANIGVLAVFKYFDFINQNITDLLVECGFKNPIPFLNILLPVGLSFHTFQAMSYTIEVYRGNQKSERHFGIYALYVMFYPQLVAGPIERPQNIIHQFKEPKRFEYSNVSAGLKLMIFGFFKKLVIADNLAVGVDEVYNHLQLYHGLALATATFFFAIQIYCDFSGYSDIALGAAKVMGFKLMSNFDRPYSSGSISEFWSRWHISLSSWFKDYLYISLGGNRVKISRLYFNLFVVFLVSGLWLNCFNVIAVFILVSFAWIFFRAKTLQDALYVIKNLLDIKAIDIKRDLYLNQGQDFFIISFLMIGFMELVQFLESRKNSLLFNNPSLIIRWSFCTLLVFMICVFGIYHQNSEFIYFQF